jgi:hypothetical protein
MLLDFFGADRLERSEADIESNFGHFDTAPTKVIENPRTEVEPCGWRGYRSSLPCEDGLVTVAIGRSVCAFYIRRQGYVTEFFNDLAEAPCLGRETQHTEAVIAAPFDRRFKLALAKDNPFACGHFAARADQALPDFTFEGANQEHFNLSAEKLLIGETVRLGMDTLPMAKKASRQNAGIIQNQKFVTAKYGRKFAECAVLERASSAIQQQKPGTVTLRQGLLSDVFRRQSVIEIAYFHGLLRIPCPLGAAIVAKCA